ncbi:MAG: hypothetical protein HY660_17510 [Armatimonadetes bacterium]|nr:hypothetical protein [Armatimonadota bacterium]
MRSRPTARSLFWVVVALLVASVPAVGGPGAPRAGGTLTVGSLVDVESLDAHHHGTAHTHMMVSQIYEQLLDLDPQGRYIGVLAESWNISNDGVTYTFRLRKNVKFHDGTPFTAEAVKVNLERVVDPATKARYAGRLGAMQSVQVVDDHTVAIRLRRKDILFLEALRSPAYIVSPAALRRHGKDYGTHPAGTGPFKIQSYAPDDRLVLVRNEDYWGGRPPLDRVVFRPVPEQATRLVELESGGVDVITDVPHKDAKTLEARRIQVLVTGGFQADYYVFNLKRPPLDDVRVRKAINHAIDRDTLTRVVYRGYAIKSITGYPPNGWAINTAVKGYDFDPERAAQLLQEAGWKPGAESIREKGGTRLRLHMPTPSHQVLLAQLIQGQLRRVGIETRLDMTEAATYWDAVRTGKFDLGYWVRFVGHAEPSAYFNYFDSKEHWFTMQQPHPEIEALLNEGVATIDPAARKRIYDQVQRRIADEALVIWITHPKFLFALRPHVKGVVTPPSLRLWLHKAWVER